MTKTGSFPDQSFVASVAARDCGGSGGTRRRRGGSRRRSLLRRRCERGFDAGRDGVWRGLLRRRRHHANDLGGRWRRGLSRRGNRRGRRGRRGDRNHGLGRCRRRRRRRPLSHERRERSGHGAAPEPHPREEPASHEDQDPDHREENAPTAVVVRRVRARHGEARPRLRLDLDARARLLLFGLRTRRRLEAARDRRGEIHRPRLLFQASERLLAGALALERGDVSRRSRFARTLLLLLFGFLGARRLRLLRGNHAVHRQDLRHPFRLGNGSRIRLVLELERRSVHQRLFVGGDAECLVGDGLRRRLRSRRRRVRHHGSGL